MKFCSVPDIDQALDLHAEIGTRENILEHSLLVMKVANAICDHLRPEASINRELVAIAALLHDITKTRALTTHEHHDKTGGAYMRERGCPEIAEIIENHVDYDSFSPDAPLNEIEIVHYADKRVKHSQMVTIEERIADLIIRYGKTQEIRDHIASRTGFLRALEDKITQNMHIPIDTALANIQ